MKMLLAGGGTGGHLFPALAIAEQLLRDDSQSEVCFVGTKKGLEARLLPKLGFQLEFIDMVGVVGRGVRGIVQLLPKMLKSLRQSWLILQRFQPDIVVGVGGYASFPVLITSKLKGIPFILHEQNAVPGLSNRVLAGFARRICLSIPDSGKRLPRHKLVMTGNPLRQAVAELSSALPGSGEILAFGGSRGAHAINELLAESLPLLRRHGVTVKVVHQTGDADLDQIRAVYQSQGETNIEVIPFIEDMASAYKNSRLVICRAGATTIAELCACGRPALMIPLPSSAADHQTANARAMEAAGAAIMLTQHETSAEKLANTIAELWLNRDRLQVMAEAAASLGQKDAARRVVAVCIQVLTEG
ncbi:undecaprenyldiphospho-muramoylpentapeptide beta-N-acetylglucosaminyltransferase [Geopsychrobacter electrodiphilus]|uniref:undecaprenyldiphospho-muramoylpentapeptide beta-N-acetylglucosaminyltransferase n=1 Tax=Geopsychrobacter electrodiphilus TaxID=225196 RepID=UPI00037A9650|nr:undecaprenyldiphospho-muramoylpentapeptide beta-N-acetylglucosaminyltransferase [Geopsychrobacter electrodiphilus]